jgi:integrase
MNKHRCNLNTSPTGSATVKAREDAPQHTAGHIQCPACDEANVQLLEIDNDLSRKLFSVASLSWLTLRKQSRLKPRAIEAIEAQLSALERFFGPIRLIDITPGHLRTYQTARAANSLFINGAETRPWSRPVGNSAINHDLSTLAQLLRHCKLWAKLQPYYFPLHIPNWSPREVLSEEDEVRFFEIAAECPEAALAYWVACITNNTTASGLELRGLRLKHVFLRDKKQISEIYVPEDAVKNTSRPRKIALNSTARWAMEQCHRRALALGSYDPNHFLFPFRSKRNTFDPTRPASRSFLRKSWDRLRDATGFPDICPHDLRHLCITRMLENDVQPETVRSIAGHVTQKMMEYYSHHRRETKYAAVMAIDPKHSRRRTETTSRPGANRKTA